MFVCLFTYDRHEMLKETISHLETFDVFPKVFYDGVTFPFRGKQHFWETWEDALTYCACYGFDKDLFLFMPEDFQDIDIERIKEYHKQYKNEPYVFNIINDGRHQQWRRFPKLKPKDGVQQVGFTDCGFFCNREALEAIGFYMDEVPASWFAQGENMSSGVGYQLTKRFTEAGVKMYKPIKSLAYHGDHESKMHPNERKKNPLISR